MINYKRLISASILLTVTGLAVAQTSTNSPYTRYGFGQLADQNFGNSKAMGGIAYGLRNGYQINASNPASYTAIDSLTFLFDAGMTLQNANFKDGNVKTNAKNSSFDYLAMQFRLWKKMGMTVGFLPFSTVGYSISKTHDFEDVNNNGKWSESYDGDGGFHQVFIGLGYKVFNNLSVGANFSYLYGDITHQSMTTIGATDTRSIKLDKFSISDYKLDFGLQYTYKLNKKNTINIGAVYTLGRTLHGDAYKYHQTGAESNGSIYVQSQTGDTIPNPFKMPHTFGIGLTYVYDNRLTIGVDYTLQKWNTADLAWSKFNKESVEMNSRTKIAFGAEFVPSYISHNYLKRICYLVILISGYDGGTGAAPRSSIQNAGLPWELGLAETHQTLIQNGLRERVRIETDGKLMSGRDVAIAAMLGAEEFGFATAPLVTMGCVMMRVCNLDTCPVGVATQNPELRKRFTGKPEYVVNFMRFIAEELREYMAKLGVRTVDELVGRTDLLKVKDVPTSRRAAMLDLSSVLYNPYAKEKKGMIFNPKKVYDFELGKTLDEKVLVKQLLPALERGEKRGLEVDVTNTDRAFGTIFGSEITRRYPEGLEEDSFVIQCKGAGGQSFGAFIPKGLTLELTGDSNDYFGKGLSGGKLVVCQPKGVKFKSDENIIIGNVALYGATSGKVFVGGVAGERFAVRNSGVRAVVEGVGDHGCEYMTGGCVVVLGQVGKNFAAGMSGGIAYVLDLDSRLYQKVNKAMVNIERVTDKYDVQELKGMIQEHVAYTNSEVGKKILDNFKEYLPKFKKIIPEDYEKMMSTIIQMEEKGLSREKAKIEAFNLIKNGR